MDAQPPCDADAHAIRIAEAIANRWYTVYGAGHVEVPLGVSGTLSLLRKRDPEELGLAGQIRRLDADGFAAFCRSVWRTIIRVRPDLTHLVFPTIEWLHTDPTPELVTHAKHVADAALDAGHIEFTATGQSDAADLLGAVLTVLRADRATRARGQFYTPPALADTMAALLGVPHEGESVYNPALGTGGLFRATAQAMRQRGRDPATVTWVGCDIDALAIACAAVNTLVWGLGPHVLLAVGDSLAGDVLEHARRQRDELIHIADTIGRVAHLRAAIDAAQRLLACGEAGAERQDPSRP